MEEPGLNDVIDFWFGNHASDLDTVTRQSTLWWRKDAQTDDKIRERFLPLYQALENDSLISWETEPLNRLALIILADQFPRNMFRNSPRAFALDGKALALAEGAIALEMDRHLRWPQRLFMYMPLEHSESLAVQEKSLQLFRKLADSVPGNEQDKACGYMEFAIRHREIINRFGRFPHRNAVLGRQSTAEELAFLQQPGSSF